VVYCAGVTYEKEQAPTNKADKTEKKKELRVHIHEKRAELGAIERWRQDLKQRWDSVSCARCRCSASHLDLERAEGWREAVERPVNSRDKMDGTSLISKLGKSK